MKRGKKHLRKQKLRKWENAHDGFWRKSLWTVWEQSMNADSEALQSGQRRRHFLLLGPVNLFSFYRVPKIHVSDTNPGRRLVSWPMGVKAERIPWVWQRDLIVTPASFKSRYPLSVFNVNSTLKDQLVSMIQERVTRIHSTAKLRHCGDHSRRGGFLRSTWSCYQHDAVKYFVLAHTGCVNTYGFKVTDIRSLKH